MAKTSCSRGHGYSYYRKSQCGQNDLVYATQTSSIRSSPDNNRSFKSRWGTEAAKVGILDKRGGLVWTESWEFTNFTFRRFACLLPTIYPYP